MAARPPLAPNGWLPTRAATGTAACAGTFACHYIHIGLVVQVPDADLDWHIREAVSVARPCRIGHGVDLPLERDALATLAEMKVGQGGKKHKAGCGRAGPVSNHCSQQ